jgi:hypothetical protein
MQAWPDNPFVRWFRLAVWLGVLGNLIFAIPAVFFPGWLLSALCLPPVYPTIWLRDAGGLLFFLTLLYIPAATDPFRYNCNAMIAVGARLTFGLFWFWAVCFAGYPTEFLTLAWVDFVVGMLLLLTYIPLVRHEYLRPEAPDELSKVE